MKGQFFATGHRCVALGVNSKIVASGTCGHPSKREIKLNRLDGLPISEQNWTHCIFCKGNKYCYFGGQCGHRIPIQKESENTE